MAAMPTARFRKTQRVRRRGEFQTVFDQGVRIHGRYLTVVMAPASGALSRLGIIASKKLGIAVSRNRAKRLIREVFRHHAPGAGRPVDVPVMPRRELLETPYEAVEADFRGACRRALARLGASGR